MRGHRLRLTGIKTFPAGALILLCLLWAVASLRPDLLPASLPQNNTSPLLKQAGILAMFAIIAAITAFLQSATWPHRRLLLQTLLIGACLITLPALLVELAKGYIDDPTRVALFSLVPVFAVVLEPHLDSASQSPPRAALACALAAVAGTLLIFPVELPTTPAAALAFGGMLIAVISVAAANALAVKLARDLSPLSLCGFAAIAAGSAAFPLAVAGLCFAPRAWPAVHISAWAILDLLALALLFWLMRRMSAIRMTTRFLIAPLIANVIALAFLRPGVQTRAWLGLLLIALGSGWLLLSPEDDAGKSGSPLGIH
jgi:drug/metabolite transporter (DMT)-like permease